MVRKINVGLGFAALVAALLLQAPVRAQDSMQQDSMKQDEMKKDSMKPGQMQDDKMKHDDKMMHDDKMAMEGKAKTLETGTFHGRVHATSGRATVYQEADGKLVLRLTNFKTSNGPDVHVVLVATKDADVTGNSFKSDTERLELGKMKGNEGDQNYDIPAGTDLTKFHVVSIYCVRFNANFGTAPLEKF
jgi:pentapeptide MXKDX repeat protein